MNIHTLTLLVAALASATADAAPVIEEKDWTESFDVSGTATLSIDIIWGDITIRRGAGDKVALSIHTVREAADAENFQHSLTLIPFRLQQTDNGVYLSVGRPDAGWNGRRHCHECKLRVDVIATVPANSRLDVHTVNEGSVRIAGVSGQVSASNVNGPVSADDLTQCGHIETINGDVDVVFGQSPGSDCLIETMNGDIELALPAGAGADFAVALTNGRIRSRDDLAAHALPATVSQTTRRGRQYYKIEQLAGLRLGSGGNTITLKSFNGDVSVARSQ